MRIGVEERISSVESGLLYDTAFLNRGYKMASLMERMEHCKVPGVSIAIINDFKVEWAKGYGTKELGTANWVDENSMFQAASISKSVFSVAVMRLVKEGILNLEEDISKYLTSWKILSNGEWVPNVSLRQLLSHTSGLTIHGFKGYKVTEQVPELIQVLNGQYPCNSEPVVVNLIPGLQYRYSGGGFTVAQQVITDVMGMPFPQLMKELVLEPLGMENSTYEQPLPLQFRSSAAVAHSFTDKPIEGKWHVHPEMAAAGLWTTPSDLAKFGIAMQLAVKDKGEGLLSDVAEEMLTPQVEDHYGLGFRLYGNGTTARFGHGGSNEGYRSRVTFYRNIGMGAVIMMNSWREELISEIERAIAYVYEWPDFLRKDRTIVEVPSHVLSNYIGEYITGRGLSIRVLLVDGRLCLGIGKQSPIAMHPVSPEVFIMKDVNAEVTFGVSPDGSTVRLTIHQNNTQIEADAVR